MSRLVAQISLVCMGCATAGGTALTVKKSSGNDSLFVLARKPPQAPAARAPKKAALPRAKVTRLGACGAGASLGGLLGGTGGIIVWSGIYGSGMANAGSSSPQGFLVGVLMGAGLSAVGITLGAVVGCAVGASAAR